MKGGACTQAVGPMALVLDATGLWLLHCALLAQDRPWSASSEPAALGLGTKQAASQEAADHEAMKPPSENVM